jgi:arylsulfatase A-like enzyme
VYFADNGALGRHDTLKPLRGAKGSLLEGGIREPLLVRWPGVVKSNSRCGVPVISNDFFPTFLEAAGLKVTDPEVDGESLIGLLTQTAKLKRDAIYWHYPHYSPQNHVPAGAIRQGDYKLIEWFEKSIDGIGTPGALELFNLKKDLGEQHNLANLMPQRAAELYNKLKSWRKEVGAQEMTKDPDFTPASQ